MKTKEKNGMKIVDENLYLQFLVLNEEYLSWVSMTLRFLRLCWGLHCMQHFFHISSTTPEYLHCWKIKTFANHPLQGHTVYEEQLYHKYLTEVALICSCNRKFPTIFTLYNIPLCSFFILLFVPKQKAKSNISIYLYSCRVLNDLNVENKDFDGVSYKNINKNTFTVWPWLLDIPGIQNPLYFHMELYSIISRENKKEDGRLHW